VNAATVAVPIATGCLVVGSVFADVPREDRHVQWPVLAGVVLLGLAAAVIVLRRCAAPG
jgi:hypothetical protein